MGPGGAPVGLGFRASNNLFRGPCIKRLRNPAVEGSDGLVGLRWGVWWVPGGLDEARWVPVGPGRMFIDTPLARVGVNSGIRNAECGKSATGKVRNIPDGK